MAITVALELPPGRVGHASPVFEWLDAGAADRYLCLSQAPGSTEAVGDQHCGPYAGRSFKFAADPPGRVVGVSREKQGGVGMRQVGSVDPGIGADQAVKGLGNEDPPVGLFADHRPALAEDQLDKPRILSEALGNPLCLLSGLHAGQSDQAALALGDGLL